MTNEELAVLIQGGRSELLADLWTQTVAFIRKQAKSRMHAVNSPAVDIEDLIQSGFLALAAAANTYDAGAGSSFLGWLDLHLRTAFNQAAGTWTERQKKDPIHGCISLNAPIGDEDGKTLEDLQEDPTGQTPYEDIETWIFNQQLRQALEAALEQIPEVQAQTLRRRYFSGETQRQTAEAMGVSVQRAGQIEENAIRSLREPQVRCSLEECVEIHTPYYLHVGTAQFRRDHTSAVERIVFRREELRAQRASDRFARRR